MIRSMTGYGRCRESIGSRDITVEIRSVNSRYLETTVKMNRLYGALEDKVKRLASAYISRGKVDIYVGIDNTEGDRIELSLNREYLEGYIGALKTIKNDYGVDGEINLRLLAGKPEVFISRKPDDDMEELWKSVEQVATKAFEAYLEMRGVEGERLKADVIARLDAIEAMRDKLVVLSPASVKAANDKMVERIKTLLAGVPVDESKLLTECAAYADKCDVTEEMVRLHSHIKQFRDMLESDNAIGKKMDFLIQEINREVNTTGSKCNDTEMSCIVIEAKSEIEKIREQIQNIE